MAARVDRTASRGRPARRRPALADAAAAAASPAARRRRPHPPPALRLHRLPRAGRRQGRRARVVVREPHAGSPRQQQTATVVLPAHRGADPRPQRRRAGRGQAAADRVRDAVPAARTPERRRDELCDALQINRRKRRTSTSAREGASASQRAASPTWRARSTPTSPQAALALDLPGVGSLRRGGARRTRSKALGGPGPGLRRHRRTRASPASRCSTTRSSPARPAARRSCAIPPVTRSRPCARPRARRPAQNVRLTLDSEIQFTPRTCSRRRVRDTGAKAAVGHRDGPAHRRGPAPWPTSRARDSTASARRPGRRDATAPSPTSTSRARSSSSSRSPARSPTGSSRRTRSSRCRRRITRRRPRDQRVAPARHRHVLGARDPAVVEQRRRREDRHEDGQGAARQVDRGVRLRQADRHRVPRRGRRASCRRSTVVGLVDRQHPHGPGHRRDAHPDGRGVLDGRQQRLAVKPRLVAQVGDHGLRRASRSTA